MAVGAVIAGITGSAGLIGMFLGMYPPLLDKYTQSAYKATPVKIPDLGSAIELRFKEIIGDSQLTDIFKRSGLSAQYATDIYKMSEQLLSIGEYLTLWRRGELAEDQLDLLLSKKRLDSEDIKSVKKVSEYFPAPADLVQFAVREVYTPEVVSKFGQMEDIPDKFIEESAKAGLPKEQAKNFWASHWILPSAGQGFEMLHRRIADEETLKLLLKSLDIMPFWRDKLIQLSYRPLTRVDVRRMHDMGVLSEQEVYESYLDGGYSPDNAERMKDFTVLYNNREASGLTRASVIKAYKKNLLTRGKLSEILTEFGYSEEVVNFWMDMADLEKELEDIEAQEQDLLRQYRQGGLSLSQVKTELDSVDLPSEYVEGVITGEEQQKSAKRKMPTKGDLTDWLGLQIIDETFYSEYMVKLGYQDTDIQLYLTEFSMKQDTTERKFLPIMTYLRWMVSGIMTEETFIETGLKMKMDEEDLRNLIFETEDVGV